MWHGEKSGCKTSAAKFITVYGTVASKKTGTRVLLSAVLTLVNGRLVFGVALDVLGEPLVKLFVGIEQRRHDEVQQGPQLTDGKNTTVNTSVVFTRSHRQLTSAMVFWMGVPVSSSLFRH